MKNHTKRLLSLVLAAVMIFGILPLNALPAQAESTLTVSAYPKKPAVGQESQIFITVDGEAVTTGFTVTSSDPSVAQVDGTKVIGVRSGPTTITVVDENGNTGTYAMEVTATSVYKIGSSAFNIGNDSEGDGFVDDFGGTTVTAADGTTQIALPAFNKNPLTLDKNYYIPFYAKGTNANKSSDVSYYQSNYSGDVSEANGAYYRARNGVLYLYPMYNKYTANEKYFTTYDYINLDKSAPWQWMAKLAPTGTYDIQEENVYLNQNVTYIERGQVSYSDGRKEYVTLKLDVPASGYYNVTVNPGNKGGVNETFYMMPASVTETNNESILCNDDYKLFSIDIGLGNKTDTAKRYLNKGEYYFVISMDGNTAATSQIKYGYISSVTLELEEYEAPVLHADNSVAVGQQGTLKVTQVSSFDGEKDITNTTYTTNASDVLNISTADGVATVTGLKEGTAEVTATYTDLSGKKTSSTVTIVVNAYGELTYNFGVNAYNIGVDVGHDGTMDYFADGESIATDGVTSSLGNNWTDKNAEKFLPYYVTNASDTYVSTTYLDQDGNKYTDSNAVRYRARHVGWQIEMNSYQLPSLSYDYINTAKSDPWRWEYRAYTSFSELLVAKENLRIRPSATYSTGSEPYVVMILSVPAPGTYEIDVVATSASHNLHFYMMPVEGATGSGRSKYTNSAHYMGNLDTYVNKTGTLTNKLVAETAGDYYFVAKLGIDGAMKDSTTASTDAKNGLVYTYLKSVTLTRDVTEPAQVNHESGDMALGSYSTISVTQNQTVTGLTTLSNVKYENSNPEVLYMIVRNGVATLTAIGTGSADITVSYTDLFGIERSTVLSYTVSSNEYKYVFSERVFNYIYDVNGDGTVIKYGSDLRNYLGLNADGTLGYDKTAANHIKLKTSGYNTGEDAARYVSAENRIIFYPWQTNYASDSMTPEYQNPNMTAPWSWMPYYPFRSISNMASGNALEQGYARFGYGNGTDGSEAYLTFKLDVPTAGTYNINIDTGKTSAYNIKYYLVPASLKTPEERGDLIKAAYLLGNIDNSAGETTKTFAKYVNDTEVNGVELEAGSYYLVIMTDNDTETSASAGTTGSFYLKTVTLTPVVATQDHFTVGLTASLGENIKLNMTVNPTGSMIGGYKVFFEDELLTSFDVAFNTSKTLSVALAANQMSKEIIFQAVDGEGGDIGEPKVITLREYLKDIIEGKVEATDEIVEMAKHTYNYCAKAQILANKDLDALEGYSVEVTIADPEQFSGDLYTGETTGIAPYSMSMLLENTVTLRLYFEITEGEMGDYTFTYNGQTLTPAVRAKDGKVYVDITGINPQMYDVSRSVQVTKADGGDLVVTYSPLIYIQRTFHNANASSALKDLVKAMYGYHLAAVACTT